MLARNVLFLALAAAPAAAQESTNLFDAPRRLLDDADAPILALLDYDADGVLEALAARYDTTAGTLDVVFHENPGNGTFPVAQVVTLTPATMPTPTGNEPIVPVLVGDLDALPGEECVLNLIGEVVVVQGNGGGAPTLTTIPAANASTLLVDLDGDGVDELVRQEAPGLTIRRAVGGSWVAPSLQTVTFTGSTPSFPRLAATPLVAGGTRVWVRDSSLRIEVDFDAAGQALGQTTSSASNAGNLFAGDVDGDGDVDLVDGGSFGAFQPATLWRQDASGAFAAETLSGLEAALALVDVDQDGDLDLFGRRLQRNDGTGAFGEIVQLPWPTGSQVGDVDGDGDLDLVGQRWVWYSFGLLEGGTVPQAEPYRTPEIYSLLGGLDLDLEGDGDMDLVPFGGTGLGANLGTGTFERSDVSVVGDPGTPGTLDDQTIWRSSPGDWDGDGDLDLLVTGPTFSTALLEFRGRGVGGTSRWLWNDVAPTGLGSVFTVLPVDLDLDGDVDGVETTQRHPFECTFPGTCFDTGLANTTVYLDQGGFTFSPVSLSGDAYTVTDVVDLDADGLPDFVVAADFVGIGWARNLGGGTFGAPTYFGTDPLHPLRVDVGVGDFDGDGDVDLAAPGVGASTLLVNDGSGGFAAQPGLPGVSAYNGGVGTGFDAEDVDLDGNLDLLLTFRSETQVLLGDGAGGFALHSTYVGLGASVRIDVDRDGDLDRVATYFNFEPGIEDRTLVHRCLVRDGASGGEVEQFGSGSVGSGEVVATLGLAGVARPGEDVELRVTHGLGGAPGFLVLAPFAVQLVDVPVPGVTVYVNPFAASSVLLPLALSNPGGGAGAGRWEQPLTLPAALAGVQVFGQAVLLDPAAPGGLATTNLLRVRVAL